MQVKTFFIVLGVLVGYFTTAQTPAPPTPDVFNVQVQGATCTFQPVLPPLAGIPGAPAPYYTYYWEFGDGAYSFEERPTHTYTTAGEYAPVLYATNHYDDGTPPGGKPKGQKTRIETASASNTAMPNVLIERTTAIAMRHIRQARANEELPVILSYQNRGKMPTNGDIFIFFNEKVFRTDHFTLNEARTPMGEIPNPAGYTLSPTLPQWGIDWALLHANAPNEGVSDLWLTPFRSAQGEQLLREATERYREQRSWRFNQLMPDEVHNMFFTLKGTQNMLSDTNAIVHFEALFIPDDPGIAPDRFEAELEIVASHDPNRIAVSDTKANFRFFRRKTLGYKVQFQNNGKGPASKVAVEIDWPQGMKQKSLKPLKWYPACPICPENAGEKLACLDTTFTKDKLIFTFKNIYLPGSKQEGVTEYDSTKGFVKYQVRPERRIPKRTIDSRASIIFDKNPPVVTNRTRTRFKRGFSPGVKLGVNFGPPDFIDGQLTGGLSFSPYRSWGVYPQLEVLGTLPTDRMGEPFSPQSDTSDIGPDEKRTVTLTTGENVIRSYQFEVPVLLRKNLTNFLGIGVGAGLAGVWEQEVQRRTVTTETYMFMQGGFTLVGPTETVVQEPFEGPLERKIRPILLADVTIGSVRSGPNLGIRYRRILGDNTAARWQATLEWKF
jgi:PKD domain